MVVSVMTRATDGPEPHSAVHEPHEPDTEEPLDYLVDALNRAVARKRATRREDTENRT
jgi:hypothetical protein